MVSHECTNLANDLLGSSSVTGNMNPSIHFGAPVVRSEEADRYAASKLHAQDREPVHTPSPLFLGSAPSASRERATSANSVGGSGRSSAASTSASASTTPSQKTLFDKYVKGARKQCTNCDRDAIE